MNHLSGLDAAFLYVETPETPMHVGGLNIFELPPGYEGEFLDNLRTHIAQRMHLAPVFQRKLVNMPFELANPIWVADEDLDLEYHIRSTVLPKPATARSSTNWWAGCIPACSTAAARCGSFM